MPYTTRQMFTAFGVSHQTVKNWSRDFADFMSPTARPEKDHQRRFTDDDVRVFDLVKRLKQQGRVNEEIRAALGAGQRGELPDSLSNELAPVPHGTALAIALQRVNDLETMLQDERLKNARLQGTVDALEKMLDKAQEQVYQLRMKLDFGEKD